MLENPEFTKYIVNDSLITDSIQPTEIADKAVSQQLSLDDNLSVLTQNLLYYIEIRKRYSYD